MKRLAIVLLLLAGPAQAHDHYTSLRHPDGTHCCSNRDCRKVDGCLVEGALGLLLDGTCLPIPMDRVLPQSSPDGGLHACWRSTPGGVGFKVLCVMLGGMG